MKIDLSSLIESFPEAKSGIHIKKANRGKFTAYKKRTGKTTQEALHSDDPHVRKMANFAKNAKKWGKGENGTDIPVPPEWIKKYLESQKGFGNIPNQLGTVTVTDRNINPLPAEIAPIEKQPVDYGMVNAPTPKAGLFSNYDWGNPTAPQGEERDRNSIFTSENAATALSAIAALTPDQRKKQSSILRPQDMTFNNEHPYGTGSQAIYKDGGSLSASKAREMLKDGKANGKKITKKQRKLFQAVAHGMKTEAPDGITTGPGKESATRVTTVPKDYQFVGDEQGKKYYKKSTTTQIEDAISYKGQASGAGYEKFLQDKLASGVTPEDLVAKKYIAKGNMEGYRKYHKSIDDYIYTEQAAADQPAFAFEGEPIYKGNKLAGLLKYQSRDSKGKADGGMLNTGYQDAQFMYVDDYGKPVQSKGIYNIPYEDWNKEFGPTRHIKNDAFIEKYANNVTKLDSGGNLLGSKLAVEGNQAKPISNDFIQFEGPSHANGGIDINYGGQNVEVEGDETATQGNDGTLTVLGNMTIPGTKMKFKTAGKKLAKEQNKASMQNDQGAELMEVSNPTNKFEKLSFNAGMLKAQGANEKLAQVDKQKGFLSTLQDAMLQTAEEYSIDPQKMSEGKMRKAKNGANLKAPDGVSLSDKNNNPGNIKIDPNSKYGKLLMQKYGAKVGPASTDGSHFAVFPTREAGALAMKNLFTQGDRYKNSTVEGAINTWTNNKPYDLSGLSGLKGKKVNELSANELDKVLNYMAQGEGTKYGPLNSKESLTPIAPTRETPKTVFTPNIPSMGSYIRPNQGYTPQEPVNNEPITPPPGQKYTGTFDFQVPQDKEMPSNIERLPFEQYAPELYALATNKVEPVQAQKFVPEHYQPYQVSFQDRINNNNQTFNAIQSTLSDSPAALGTIASQVYGANADVSADEFRTNQAIQNDVTNKNVSLDNNAQMQNLQILDNQYVRQQTANSKTKLQNQEIINSITSKILQNDYANKTLATYENMSDYRFVDTNDDGFNEKVQYFGPDYIPSDAPGQSTPSTDSGYQKLPTEEVLYDKNGLPMGAKKKTRWYPKRGENGISMQAIYNAKYGRK